MEDNKEILKYYTRELNRAVEGISEDVNKVWSSFEKENFKVEGILDFYSFIFDGVRYFKPVYIATQEGFFGSKCWMFYPVTDIEGAGHKYIQTKVDYQEAKMKMRLKTKDEYISCLLILWFISHYYTRAINRFNFFCESATDYQPSESTARLYEDVLMRLRTMTYIGDFSEHLIFLALRMAVSLLRTQILEDMGEIETDGVEREGSIKWNKEDLSSIHEFFKVEKFFLCVLGYLNKLSVLGVIINAEKKEEDRYA